MKNNNIKSVDIRIKSMQILEYQRKYVFLRYIYSSPEPQTVFYLSAVYICFTYRYAMRWFLLATVILLSNAVKGMFAINNDGDDSRPRRIYFTHQDLLEICLMEIMEHVVYRHPHDTARTH